MYKATASIEFIAPFLFNRPKDERTQTGVKSEEKYRQSASENFHKSAEGELIIPAWNFKVGLVDACKQTFKGKQSITTLVKAMVFAEDLRFGVNEADGLHECWGRVPPRTGALVKVYRPTMSAGRTLTAKLNVFTDLLPPEKLKIALDQFGILVGVGSWRPEYGRFIVKDFNYASLQGEAQQKPSPAKRRKAKEE